MKRQIGALVLWTVLAGLSGGSGTPAWADTYLGVLCWSSLVTADETGPTSKGPFITRAGVTSLEGPYFLFQGSVSTPDNPMFIHATAMIVGNEVWINGSVSQDHTPTEAWRDSGIMQIRLNLSTLSGTFWSIRTDFKTTDNTFSNGYAAGTATFVPCP